MSPRAPTTGTGARPEVSAFFCYAGEEPLLAVRADAPAGERKEQACMLIQSIADVLEQGCVLAAERGDGDGAMHASTVYILKFAAEAGAAMVESLEIKS